MYKLILQQQGQALGCPRVFKFFYGYLIQNGSLDFWWSVYSSSTSLFLVRKEWKIDQRSTYTFCTYTNMKGKIKRLLCRAPYGSTQVHWSIFGFEKIGSVVNPQYIYIRTVSSYRKVASSNTSCLSPVHLNLDLESLDLIQSL